MLTKLLVAGSLDAGNRSSVRAGAAVICWQTNMGRGDPESLPSAKQFSGDPDCFLYLHFSSDRRVAPTKRLRFLRSLRVQRPLLFS